MRRSISDTQPLRLEDTSEQWIYAAANDLADKAIHLLASDAATSETLYEYYHLDTVQPLSHSDLLIGTLLVLEII